MLKQVRQVVIGKDAHDGKSKKNCVGGNTLGDSRLLPQTRITLTPLKRTVESITELQDFCSDDPFHIANMFYFGIGQY